MHDGCTPDQPWADYWYNSHNCRSVFMDGLVGHGLAAAMKQYLYILTAVKNERRKHLAMTPAGSPVPVVPFDAGDAGFAHELGLNYLAGGLRRHARLRKSEAEETVSPHWQAFVSKMTTPSLPHL